MIIEIITILVVTIVTGVAIHYARKGQITGTPKPSQKPTQKPVKPIKPTQIPINPTQKPVNPINPTQKPVNPIKPTQKPVNPIIPSKIKNSNNALNIIPYLEVVYPLVNGRNGNNKNVWLNFNTADLRKLYQSLNWYYLPVVDDVGSQTIIYINPEGKPITDNTVSRRAPLAGPYVEQWCEAFLSDSTDQQIFREPINTNDLSQTCTGAVDDPFNPNLQRNKDCNDACYPTGTQTPDQKAACNLCCESGSICNADGMCQSNATTAFCSVFPSTVANAEGPVWGVGAQSCALSELTGDKTTPECIGKLYGTNAAGTQSLCQKEAYGKTGPLCANKGSADYQFITVIQPYGRKQGCPNYAYMEQVAYVCEGTGRQLLTAPKNIKPNIEYSEWVGAFGRNMFCDIKCPIDASGGTAAMISQWTQCIDSAQQWKDSNGIFPITEGFETFGKGSCKTCKHEYTTDTDIDTDPRGLLFGGTKPKNNESNIPGNLKGSSLGPSGCTFLSGWNVFNATGPNGKGMWTPDASATSNIHNYINGHAIYPVGGKEIPAKVGIGAVYDLANCSAHPNYTDKSVKGVTSNNCADKTMFYWEAGYGKFLSMGKTGIYQNYIHFFLTVPNTPQKMVSSTGSETIFLRSSVPEMLSMGVGASALQSLEALWGKQSYMKDKRQFLSGFCTTFQKGSQLGKKYGLLPGIRTKSGKTIQYVYDFNAKPDDWNNKVVVITGRMYWAKTWGPHCDPLNHGKIMKGGNNTWYGESALFGEPPGVENTNGLTNPQEGIQDWMTNYLQLMKNGNSSAYMQVPDNFIGDPNLCAIASQCIQCYYPPNLEIENPHYNQGVGMEPDDALILWQAMYIYGDTGGDGYGYETGPAVCRQLGAGKCESFPYGSYYFSASIGSCIYAITAGLGWNSTQFACMSTGGGNSKFCTYPGYDYEIVYIGNRNAMVSNADPYYSFKLMDITGGGQKSYLDFYTNYGFVQGSTANGESNAIEDMKTRYTADEKLYGMVPFDACKMPLNEINVDPSVWGSGLYRPNSMFYNKPAGSCNWNSGNYEQCITQGGAPNGWVYADKQGNIITGRTCPYQDAKGSVRSSACALGNETAFVPEWMLDTKGQYFHGEEKQECSWSGGDNGGGGGRHGGGGGGGDRRHHGGGGGGRHGGGDRRHHKWYPDS
jgi:hypothetical protein